MCREVVLLDYEGKEGSVMWKGGKKSVQFRLKQSSEQNDTPLTPFCLQIGQIFPAESLPHPFEHLTGADMVVGANEEEREGEGVSAMDGKWSQRGPFAACGGSCQSPSALG
jgi:hypothetical protein